MWQDMSFKVRDLKQEHFVSTEEELSKLSTVRYEGYNSIWITLPETDFPYLNVAFNEDLAVVNYYNNSETEEKQLVSKGDGSANPSDGSTIFYFDMIGVEQEMSNGVVVSSVRAFPTLFEFVNQPYEAPRCIDWIEL